MKLIWIIFFTSLQSWAQSLPAVRPPDFKWNFDIESKFKGRIENIKFQNKNGYKWVTNLDGVRVLQWITLIDTPWDLTNEKPLAADAHMDLKFKGTKLRLETSLLSSVVTFLAGRELVFKWKSPKPVLIDENCDKSFLALKPAGTEAPFFIGISCSLKNEEVSLHLNFPAEVELIKSSLFEVAGKGENYRLYDLKKVSAAKVKIAEFEFLFQGNEYKYSLNSLKAESEKEKTTPSRFIMAAGQASLALRGNNLSFSDSKPLLTFQLLPKKIWNDFHWGFNIESTFGSQAEANSLSYYQVTAHLGYSWKLSQNLELHPRLYNVISGQSSASGIGYQTNQLGAGFWIQWNLSENFLILLEAMTEGLGSPVIKAHNLAAVSVFYQDWGLGIQTQNYSVADVNENIRKFSQTVLSLQRAF